MFILNQMLEFNPNFRPTAEKLLKNKYFDDIRVPKNEKGAPHRIICNIDNNELAYDYEEDTLGVPESFAIKTFKKKIIGEVSKFSNSTSSY